MWIILSMGVDYISDKVNFFLRFKTLRDLTTTTTSCTVFQLNRCCGEAVTARDVGGARICCNYSRPLPLGF